jgi:hypothetical protein
VCKKPEDSPEGGQLIFLLRFFHRLLPHVDILYNQTQVGQLNPVKLKNFFREFITAKTRFGMVDMCEGRSEVSLSTNWT